MAVFIELDPCEEFLQNITKPKTLRFFTFLSYALLKKEQRMPVTILKPRWDMSMRDTCGLFVLLILLVTIFRLVYALKLVRKFQQKSTKTLRSMV